MFVPILHAVHVLALLAALLVVVWLLAPQVRHRRATAASRPGLRADMAAHDQKVAELRAFLSRDRVGSVARGRH